MTIIMKIEEYERERKKEGERERGRDREREESNTFLNKSNIVHGELLTHLRGILNVTFLL